MKAWVLENVGNIALQDRVVPEPTDGEVRIRVKAAGICGSDIPRIYETGAHRMPLVLGHEFAGVVDAVGEGVSSEWTGKRVAVFPKIPCGKCEFCRSVRSNLCKDYDYVGSRRDGAFAEYVTVPASNLLELPDGVCMEVAAMVEPLAVSANAVRTARRERMSGSEATDRVVVCGMGTIGLMIVLFLVESGFKNIYVIGNREEQRGKVVEVGIPSEHFCNSRECDSVRWMMEQTGGSDIYFECVGSNESIRYGLEIGVPGALQVLVGNPRSDMSFSRDVYWQIPRNQMKLIGVWNSTFSQKMSGDAMDDWHYVRGRLESGVVDPLPLITHRFSIDELGKGFRIMRDKTENYTKVMMVNE